MILRNPFENDSMLDLPLPDQLCQELHAAALRDLSAGVNSEGLEPPIDRQQLRRRLRLQGPSALLAHPADVRQIFAGVTVAVFQAIANVYCDRLGRSMQMTSSILTAMAKSAGRAPISEEAIWAICAHLHRERVKRTAVSCESQAASWLLMRIDIDVTLKDDENNTYCPGITCVVDPIKGLVLSFRVGNFTEGDKNAALAVYDALISLRRPTVDGSAGLVWGIPERLQHEIQLPVHIQEACRDLGMDIQVTSEGDRDLVLIKALRGNWTRDLSGRVLSERSFSSILDNYLAKVHGHGPRNAESSRARILKHLIGYNREPASLFPALRQFLPLHPAYIDTDGAVEFGGLHYESDLLRYWPDHQVTVRRSEQTECTSWIYLNGEILCQAMARELKRGDGSYRSYRPRRS